MEVKPKYTYQLKTEGTSRSSNLPANEKVFKYNSAKAVGGIIEALDDPRADFEGVITIRRIKNDG